MKRSKTSRATVQIVRIALLTLLALPGASLAQPTGIPSGNPAGSVNEEFHYRWSLRNFVGAVVGLFFPNHGEGDLTFKSDANGHLTSQLVITSSESGGDYWRYGAEIDPVRLQPIRAWSSYAWRGRSKSESQEVTQQGVMDIVSAIYSIRRDPPDKTRRLTIWSDEKVYPVDVIPRGAERRVLPAGAVDTRHYAIRGVDDSQGRRWKGKVDLWLATDPAATPAVIQISRSLADVRLEMTSLPKAAQPAAVSGARAVAAAPTAGRPD